MPRQQHHIAKLMAGLRRRAKDPGPRKFPQYRPGMSTCQYVMEYKLANLNHACFSVGDLA